MKKVIMSWTETEQANGAKWQGLSMNLWYGILEHLGYEVYYYDYYGYNADDFYNQCKEIGADYVFQAAYTQIHTEFIKLKQFAKVFLLHADINYRYDTWTKYFVPYIDGLITFDEGDCANDVKTKVMQDGIHENNFVKMLWSFNPRTMTYPIHTFQQKDIFLSFVGHLHANRPQKMVEFAGLGSPIYNPTWVNTTYEDAKNIWARSKYTLCFTWNAPMTKRVIPARILEMAPHSILMSEISPGLERYFKKNEEFIEFDGVKEGLDRIKSIGEKEYTDIFNNTRRKIWKQMTCLHEWNRILPQIDEDYKMKSDEEIANILKENYGEYYYQ